MRTFDDPATWTEPGRRQWRERPGRTGVPHRADPRRVEFYDLDDDPVESRNRREDPGVPSGPSPTCVSGSGTSSTGGARAQPAVALRRAARRVWPSSNARARRSGCCAGSPSGWACTPTTPSRHRAGGSWSPRLVIATNHDRLADGTPTGVYASELTVPYYHAFEDAGMYVDVASPLVGGSRSTRCRSPVLRTEADDRYLGDDVLHSKLEESLAVGDLR